MQAEGLLDRLPRVHAVTYRDIRAPGEPADNALPATDRKQDMPWPPGCAFRLATGPKPVGRKAAVTLEFAPGTPNLSTVRVFVNSVECPPSPGANGPILTYPVPAAILQDEAQVVEVLPHPGAPFTIVRVEMAIAAKD